MNTFKNYNIIDLQSY